LLEKRETDLGRQKSLSDIERERGGPLSVKEREQPLSTLLERETGRMSKPVILSLKHRVAKSQISIYLSQELGVREERRESMGGIIELGQAIFERK